MDILAFSGSSVEVLSVSECIVVDADVNGAGRPGLGLTAEQWVGSGAVRHLKPAHDEVSPAELQPG